MSEVLTLKILFVEDDIELREAGQWLLEQYFSTVHVAENATKAIEALSSRTVDAVISDYSLGANQTALHIRDWINENAPQIYFMLITGYAEEPALLKYLEKDHFTVLQKPAHPNELILPLQKLAQTIAKKNSAA